MTNYIDNNGSHDGTQPEEALLPPVTAEQQINLSLLELAESDPSAIRIELRLKEIHKEFDVGTRALRQAYDAIVEGLHKQPPAQAIPATPEEEAVQLAAEEAAKEWQLAVEARAHEIAASSDIASEFQRALREQCGYIASRHSAATVVITHAARLLNHSMGFVISGPSGSGKSGLVERAALFLPEEVLVPCTSASAQALYYVGSLEHKYWLGGELRILKPGEDDPAQQAMRQLISENKVTRIVVDKQDGQLVSKTLETRGPAVVVQTTTQEHTAFNDEFANRLSWLYTSDDRHLTGQVLTAQAESAARIPDDSRDAERQLEMEAWQAYHRSLVPFKVVIPYAHQIVPESRVVTIRRVYPLLIDYITASALLHQATRTRVTEVRVPYIIADIDDYRLAYDLIMGNAPRVLDMVSKRGRELHERLKQLFGTCREFTIADAQKRSAMSLSSVKRYVRELREAGCIRYVEAEGKSNVYKICEDPAPTQEFFLVSPSAIDVDGSSAQDGSNDYEPSKAS